MGKRRSEISHPVGLFCDWQIFFDGEETNWRSLTAFTPRLSMKPVAELEPWIRSKNRGAWHCSFEWSVDANF